jgi:gliding-associated putative ABC transporter substrate-binding component GldG
MTRKKAIDSTVSAIAVIAILILVNVLSISLFGRADLTRDKQFTLSDASKDAVRSLKTPVTVTAYFTKDLPPPYSTNARYVKDLLEEYYNASADNFRYELVDPTAEETDAEKEKKKEVKQDIFGRQVREATSMEKELQTLGIPPVQVRVNEDDKLEVKRAYMGIAVKVGDKHEVIPVVQETAQLEYDLTTLIRKLTREKAPKVALLQGHQGPSPQEGLQHMMQLLQANYDVTPLDLTQTPEIGDDVDALIVAGPVTPLTDGELHAIDAFVMSGRSAAFFVDNAKADLQEMQAQDTAPGLNALLSSYGVTVEPGLILDPHCATLNVAQQRGAMRIMQPVRYPYVPIVDQMDEENPITRGLGGMAFPFVASLTVKAPEGATATVLAQSSKDSWVMTSPYNLDPLQRWTQDMVKDQGAKAMMVTLTGTLKSPYGAAPNAAVSSRVLVAGGSAFIQDQYSGKGNEAFILNMIDWMVMDEALLAVRSRGLAAAPIGELGDHARNAVKFANILGLPFAFVAFGLVRWRMRESRRAKVTL